MKHWTQYRNASQESNLQVIPLLLPFKAAPGNFTCWYLHMTAWNMTSEYLILLWCNVSKMHTAPSCLPSQLVWENFIPKGEEGKKVLCNWMQWVIKSTYSVESFFWVVTCYKYFLNIVNRKPASFKATTRKLPSHVGMRCTGFGLFDSFKGGVMKHMSTKKSFKKITQRFWNFMHLGWIAQNLDPHQDSCYIY